MTTQEEEKPDLSVLPWLEAAAGNKLLAYMLGSDVETLRAVTSGEVPLSTKQAEMVNEIAAACL